MMPSAIMAGSSTGRAPARGMGCALVEMGVPSRRRWSAVERLRFWEQVNNEPTLGPVGGGRNMSVVESWHHARATGPVDEILRRSATQSDRLASEQPARH